ncbi:hypothetical protein V6N12_013512 [Hibiscus sabdariffa]|uniref:Uncharacterized protein n=1 Tax=Hibiscus sabdariffa TaxID=183260 RepID=A0ABR2CAB1_9ROSI
MVVVVMVVAVVLVDQALNMAKLVHMARDGEGAVMVEAVLFLGLLQELLEEWVGHVHHRDHKPLLFFSLTNHDGQPSLWNISQLLVSRVTKVEIQGRKEKGQGSDAEMASLKRVKQESVKDLGTLLIINPELYKKIGQVRD